MIKIAGIAAIRNEEHIIGDTLDHFGSFCDALYIYDDCSSDKTIKICHDHKKVKKLIQGTVWNTDRYWGQTRNRQRIFEVAKEDSPEWILYFDADERIEWDFKGYDAYDGIVMKLFDFYITEEDTNEPYYAREWIGPEFRNILMMYRPEFVIGFNRPAQREALLDARAKLLHSGYIKHYGKAISIEEWEKACEYYSTYFGEPYKTKWENRKGKAIHCESDFGRPLIKWDDKEKIVRQDRIMRDHSLNKIRACL